MTVRTILIINSVALVAMLIALGVFILLYYKAEKKSEYYFEKGKQTFEKLKNLHENCADLSSKVIICEERVQSAYELGYKESKHSVQQKIANECYDKVLELHPDTNSQFTELFEEWLKEKYNIEVKHGE